MFLSQDVSTIKRYWSVTRAAFPKGYKWERELDWRGRSNPQISPSDLWGARYWSHLNEAKKEKSLSWSLCKEKEIKEKQFDAGLPQSCLWVKWQ